MIGKRIRFIRKKRNMTMKYLGMAVGLPENNADIRIAQYESGTRTPKDDLLFKIANELAVSPDTLFIPDLDTLSGAMHTLFVLEDLYGFRVSLENCTSDRLNNAILEWQRKFDSYSKGEINKEQYDDWRYNYK